MSTQTQPLLAVAPPYSSRAGIISPLTNLSLDSDSGKSSLTLWSGAKPLLYIDGYGNTGINICHPTSQLEVASSNGSCVRLRYGNAATAPSSDLFMSSGGSLVINNSTIGSKTSISKSLDIIEHDGVQQGLMLGGSLVLSTASQLNYMTVSPGAAVASKALVVDSAKSIIGLDTIGTTSLALGLSTLTMIEAAYLTSITPGTAIASKAIVVDSAKSIAGLNSIGAGVIALTGNSVSTSAPTLNISAGSSNLYINGTTKQIGINTQAPQAGYMLSVEATATQCGMYLSGGNTLLSLNNVGSSASTGRTSIQFVSDSSSVLEIGQRNSLVSNVPNGFYISNVNYLLTLSTAGILSLPLASATFNIGNTTSGFSSAAKVVVCNSTVAANSRQGIYIGHSLSTNNSACFSHYNVAAGSTSSRLGIGFYGLEDAITVLPTGRVGIGNTTPAVPLHISASLIATFGNSTTSCGYLTNSLTATTKGTMIIALGLRVDASIHVGGTGVYVTSDRRIKQNIEPIRKSDAIDFIMNVDPCSYRLKESPYTPQIGYIAQDLRASKFADVVSTGFQRPDFAAEAPGDVDDVVLVAQYERICCILHKGLQDALQRISKLEATMKLR